MSPSNTPYIRLKAKAWIGSVIIAPGKRGRNTPDQLTVQLVEDFVFCDTLKNERKFSGSVNAFVGTRRNKVVRLACVEFSPCGTQYRCHPIEPFRKVPTCQ